MRSNQHIGRAHSVTSLHRLSAFAEPSSCLLYLSKSLKLNVACHMQAMARLWRVAHFVLSDFLNLTLDEASSSFLAEAPNLSAMAQVSIHLVSVLECNALPTYS